MTTPPASQQQISTFARQVAFLDNVSIDSVLASIPAPRRIEHCNFPALQEETQDSHNVGIEDGQHPIPGRGVGRTTSESGDAVNEQLLHDEQLVIQAVRTILAMPIVNNAITVKHYRWIVMILRDKLLQGGPHEVAYREAFAQILLRVVERLITYPSRQEYSGYVLYSRRSDHVGCLNNLLTDMEEGFVFNQQTGNEDDVFIIKNKELHTDHLCFLASRLRDA